VSNVRIRGDRAFADDLSDRIAESIDVRKALLRREILESFESVTRVVLEAVRRGSLIMFFGNGGSSADAGHLAAELLGRFAYDRRPLAAIALADNTAAMTAIGNDYGYEEVFARQLLGLGRTGDVAIGLSTSGNSLNVVRAFEAAASVGVTTIAFTGGDGGKLADLADHSVVVPSFETPRIQEAHMLLGHTLCEIVERQMFPGEGSA
jgi:D-sedoheptulose 7-phosphate isomerase